MSVRLRGSVGSLAMPKQCQVKPQAIRFSAAMLISTPLQVVRRATDPALRRLGTDFMTLRVVMHTNDAALRRLGTDFMTLGVVMHTNDPALPRIGTNFMTLRVVMRIQTTRFQ